MPESHQKPPGEPYRVLAVDPGKTTGWAVFSQSGELQASGQAPLDDWLDGLSLHGVATVVIEDFVISPRTLKVARTERPWSLEGIGVLRYLARDAGSAFVLQKAAQVKPLMTNFQLERLGLSVKGGHAQDAVRHGAYYLARKGIVKLAVPD